MQEWSANYHFHILRLFDVLYQIFHSPQAKRCAIISCKHGISKLSHELPNDLRSQEIRKYQESAQTPQNDKPSTQSPQNQNFLNTSKKLLKTRTQTFPTMRHSTRKLESIPDIL